MFDDEEGGFDEPETAEAEGISLVFCVCMCVCGIDDAGHWAQVCYSF